MSEIKFTSLATDTVPSEDITAQGIGSVQFSGNQAVVLRSQNANPQKTTGSLSISDFETFVGWCRTQLYDVTLNADQSLTYSRPGVDPITIGPLYQDLSDYFQKVLSGLALLGQDAVLLHPWGILIQNPQYNRTFVIDC